MSWKVAPSLEEFEAALAAMPVGDHEMPAKSMLRNRAHRNMLRWLDLRKRSGQGRHDCRERIAAIANVEHILAAVDSKYRERDKYVPKWINRRRLRAEIQQCASWYRINTALNDADLGRNRVHRLEQFSRLASKLREHLDDRFGELAFTLAIHPFPVKRGDPDSHRVPTIPELKNGLLALKRFADKELKRGIIDGPIAKRELPATVELVGVHLPRVYKRWFCKKRAGRSRPYNTRSSEFSKAGGPFINFVEAVLKDLDIQSTHKAHLSPETISKYLGQARKAAKAGQIRHIP